MRRSLAAVLCMAFLLTIPALATEVQETPAAAIVIENGAESTAAEYEPGAYSVIRQEDLLLIDGLEISSGDYGFRGLTALGQDTVVRLQKANMRLGFSGMPAEAVTGGGAVLTSGTLYISDANFLVEGPGRWVTAGFEAGTLVVNGSTLIATEGAYGAAASIPLISGSARGCVAMGDSSTYLLSSTVMAEGGVALMTASAGEAGLDVYTYDADAIAEESGCALAAAANCRAHVYGSRISGAEVGCIVAGGGQIHAYHSGAAQEDLLSYHEGETANKPSAILGGRNAVMFYSQDGETGTFSAEKTSIATSRELLGATEDYGDMADLDHISGAVFFLRATGAEIALKNVTLDSYSGVLFQSAAGEEALDDSPITIDLEDMDVSGDILHEDNRPMTILMEETTLSGDIFSNAREGVKLTVGADSTWNVTGDSRLTGLTLKAGGAVNGDVTLDGEPLIPEPGVSYTGEILVTGSYVPQPEEPETAPEPGMETPVAPAASPAAAVSPTPAAAAVPAEETELDVTDSAQNNWWIAGLLAVLALGALIVAILRRRQ